MIAFSNPKKEKKKKQFENTKPESLEREIQFSHIYFL